jgi:hypothetical protein
MAVQRQVGAFTDAKPSGADLRGKEYHFAILDNAGLLQIAGLGAAADGVIQEGKNVDLHSTYATGNELKVIAAAVLNEGDQVASDATGQAIVAAAGHEILGKVVSPAAIGELSTIRFNPKGLHV